MPKLVVKLEFSDLERQAIDQFCREIDLPISKFCRQAVFYSIKDSYRRAEVMQREQGVANGTEEAGRQRSADNDGHHSVSQVIEGTDAVESQGEDSNSNPLPDPNTDASQGAS